MNEAGRRLAARIARDAREVSAVVASASARAALAARWERASGRAAARAQEAGCEGMLPIRGGHDTAKMIAVLAYGAVRETMLREGNLAAGDETQRRAVRESAMKAAQGWWGETAEAAAQSERHARIVGAMAQVKNRMEAIDAGGARWWWRVRGDAAERAAALDTRAWTALGAAPQWLGAQMLADDPEEAGTGRWTQWAHARVSGHGAGPVPGAGQVRAVLDQWEWEVSTPPLGVVRKIALEGEAIGGEAEWGAACEMEAEQGRAMRGSDVAGRIRARARTIKEEVEEGIGNEARARAAHRGGGHTLERGERAWRAHPKMGSGPHAPVRLRVEHRRREMVWEAPYTSLSRVVAGLDADFNAYEIAREMRENEGLLIAAACKAPRGVRVGGKVSATDRAAQEKRAEAVREIAMEMLETRQ